MPPPYSLVDTSTLIPPGPSWPYYLVPRIYFAVSCSRFRAKKHFPGRSRYGRSKPDPTPNPNPDPEPKQARSAVASLFAFTIIVPICGPKQKPSANDSAKKVPPQDPRGQVVRPTARTRSQTLHPLSGAETSAGGRGRKKSERVIMCGLHVSGAVHGFIYIIAVQ